ncbi:hypothetical protein [Photorhabdus australis]|uniref:hypothetical protein n=1 Tax=Photorhabdus australis TaxID=286156 RepID=UPI0030DD7F68
MLPIRLTLFNYPQLGYILYSSWGQMDKQLLQDPALESQFMLFTIYDKDEMSDLTKEQRESLRQMLEMRKKGT